MRDAPGGGLGEDAAVGHRHVVVRLVPDDRQLVTDLLRIRTSPDGSSS
jgi:hypothetical protein